MWALVGLLLPFTAFSQGVHVHHAFENVCDGYMLYSGSADSVVWSTGHVGWTVDDLTPGTYGFEAFADGQVVEQGTREVEVFGWEFGPLQASYYSADAFTLTGSLSIQHCFVKLFNSLCCHPAPEETTVLILQDGEPYPVTSENCESCMQVHCDYSFFIALGLPFGHIYDVGVNDPTCSGVTMMGMNMIAHSCANLEVITEVVASTPGQTNGAITLVEAIPDPNEPYPISSPVLGTATLYDVTTMEPVEMFEGVGTAMWSGLAAGSYELYFSPEEYCQTSVTVIEVSSGTTGLDEVASRSELRVFPTITDGTLQLSAVNEEAIDLRIMDVHGREVMRESQAPGSLDVGALPSGPYVARMQQGPIVASARFIKR